jgi:hypothetical protein
MLKKLPDELFAHIQREVSLPDLEPVISGMTDIGVPKHYAFNNSKPVIDYVLAAVTEFLSAYRDALYYKFRSDGIHPDAKLSAERPWINYQKKNEWIPPHDHAGLISYSIWVHIPEDNKFEILYSTITGETIRHLIPVTKQSEGTIIFFPSKLIHSVHPFYNSDETRISVSGNITLK